MDDDALVPMTMDHYPAVYRLWTETPGLGIRAADEAPAIARYLDRNPGLSVVALAGSAVVGSAMAGHDGRSGFIRHVVVAPAWRRRGLATRMVERCLEGLAAARIDRAYLDILAGNEAARAFWTRLGWAPRTDLERLSLLLDGGQAGGAPSRSSSRSS